MRICCIIKPPSLAWDRAILSFLRQTNVPILERREFTYTEALICALYDHMDDDARWMIIQKYEGRRGIALLLDFPSIDICMEIVGRASDPRACAPHTIRAMFGIKAEPDVVGAWQWWENALHRPVDERERMRDLELIFPE